ncbi:hypothetical protein CASFOL_021100 [Castilleja foliolosa]|uniref:Calmodulin binding protein-like N-terminal domain-containing protein n=1 Tax=Castilleja foliolosa TaxID=1961234 RepID=A0ABD3CZ01_9LAMI
MSIVFKSSAEISSYRLKRKSNWPNSGFGLELREHDHQTTSQSSLTLHFNKVSREILTGEEIKGESNTSIELNLVDDSAGNFLDTGPQASGSIKIVLLNGESDDDSVSEFKENIVREVE